MYSNTSASGWQSAGEKAARKSTVAARPYREAGYRYNYQCFYDRAVASIAVWANEFGGYPTRAKQQFCFNSKGHSLDLFETLSSYPFIKRAVDITSLKGNAPGPDHETFYMVFQPGVFQEVPIRKLKDKVRSGRYRPGGLRAVALNNGKKVRILHIPNLVDRVVERAVALVLVPIVESAFHPNSFGFRPGIHIADAVRCLSTICKTEKRFTIGKLDLKDAFDRIPHDRLLGVVARHVPDTKMLELIQRFVCRREWVNKQGKQNVGLPQGGPMSPVLFNIYLNHVLDHVISKAGVRFVRWADDIGLLCENQGQLNEQRELLRQVLASAGLPVNVEKTYAPQATADLLKGERLELLGLDIGLNTAGEIDYRLTPGAVDSLIDALVVSVSSQRPSVSWDGRRPSNLQLCQYDIAGWLEAYAGAIPPQTWSEERKAIKSLFLGNTPLILSRCDSEIKHLGIQCPTTSVLNDLYERARRRWDMRIHRALPGVLDRLIGRKRDANPNNPFRQLVPDFLADGADLVPAPTVFVRAPGDVKPTSSEIDWRAEFAETEPF
jgi:group II intron reverse transcriptase/maturase